MGKAVPISRMDYENGVRKHIAAIRRLMKRFNPEANHCSMTILDDCDWAITYLPDDDDGNSRRVSDWYCKHTDAGKCERFYKYYDFESGKDVYGVPDEQ